MIRIENRFQLKQVRAECQAETKQEKCRVLICGGTGCLAGGSAKLYEHMKELAAEHENVQVEIGPEIAHQDPFVHIFIISEFEPMACPSDIPYFKRLACAFDNRQCTGFVCPEAGRLRFIPELCTHC